MRAFLPLLVTLHSQLLVPVFSLAATALIVNVMKIIRQKIRWLPAILKLCGEGSLGGEGSY